MSAFSLEYVSQVWFMYCSTKLKAVLFATYEAKLLHSIWIFTLPIASFTSLNSAKLGCGDYAILNIKSNIKQLNYSRQQPLSVAHRTSRTAVLLDSIGRYETLMYASSQSKFALKSRNKPVSSKEVEKITFESFTYFCMAPQSAGWTLAVFSVS
jgi:hypothetical protein